MQKAPLVTLCLATGIFLCGGLVLLGQQSALTPSAPAVVSPPAQAHESHPTQAGLPAISPEMATAIETLTRRDTEGLVEVVNPDGSISLPHEDRFQSVLVAVKGPDGKIYMGHGEDFLNNVSPE